MTISVVMAVYNQLALTRACLDSLRGTSEEFELCVIDNASTDGTAEYFTRAARYFSLRYHRNAAAVGGVAALNQGAALAAGDVLCFLRSGTEMKDVRWLQDRVTKLTGLRGAVGDRRTAGKRNMWYLRFAKRESMAVLRWIYYAPGTPTLIRKRITAQPFLPVSLRGILEADSHGGVLELADNPDSKSGARKGVGVQIPSPLPTRIDGLV